MNQPDGGFSQAPLASLFNVKMPVPAGPIVSSPASSHSSPSKLRVAPIVGALIGVVALAFTSISLGFHYRRRIQHFLISEHSPFEEMDDNQRIAKEIMDREVCWELSADEKPVEL